MTDVKCNVDNCHYWSSNKCTANEIEVDKNITTDTDMEVGRIGNFEDNENRNRERNADNNNLLGIENNNLENTRENELGAEVEDTGLRNLEEDTAVDDNNVLNTANNTENANDTGRKAKNDAFRNREQDIEAGTMGAGSDSSSQTKCNTFRPE